MEIYLDRRGCTAWFGPCETCFSWHYLGNEIIPNYCLLDTIDDQKSEHTFFIKDRDGVDKMLVVNKDNWFEVHDAWILFWEKQQEKSLH